MDKPTYEQLEAALRLAIDFVGGLEGVPPTFFGERNEENAEAYAVLEDFEWSRGYRND